MMKRLAILTLTVTAAALCMAQEGSRYSVVVIRFEGSGFAGEIVPDGEAGAFRKLVTGEYKKVLEEWKEAKKLARKAGADFTEPEPPKPKLTVFKKGLSREEADREFGSLKGLAAVSGQKVFDNWRDAYRKDAQKEEKGPELRKPRKPKGEHFSILTYNVNYGMPKPDATVKAILEAKADIVFLQETNANWENLLVPRLEKDYPHRLFRHPGEKRAGGQAVLSKHPVRELKFMESQVDWFPGWLVEAETPVGKVQVLALHLKPLDTRQGMPDAAALKELSKTHVKELESFFEHIKSDAPAVVLGDLNEGDSGEAMKWLREKGFTDALSQFDAKTPTWRWSVGGIPVEDRLDHILYSKHLDCHAAKVIRKGGSDHYPVAAGFEKAD